MLKLIFLDVDGVLNSELYYVNRPKTKHETHEEYEMSEFDPNSVKLLNKLTDDTGAKIVVSSSWRKGRSVDQLKQLFESVGITGEVLDKTPCLYFSGVEGYNYSVPRGNEIKAWLEINKDQLGSKITKVSYVILDDDSDMLYWQRDHFIHVDRYCGITPQTIFKAKMVLEKVTQG